MATLQLGMGAYRRQWSGAPEIQLVNRFVENAPANADEHTTLISRPGTVFLGNFPADTIAGRIRLCFSKGGSFNSDLFVVSGKNLYRLKNGTVTQIAGEIEGTGAPNVGFTRVGAEEWLFIADGLLLNFYSGTEHAFSKMTWDGTTAIVAQIVDLNGTYYGWNAAVDTNAPDGTAAHPFLAAPGTDPIAAMANMLNFAGTPGVDFSTALTGPNVDVTAAYSGAAGTDPNLVLTVTAIDDTAAGDAITTAVSGTGLTWAAATLAGGGVDALHGIAMPGGLPALAVATLNSYCLVSIGGQQQVYFINPGETVIDSLNFMSKEAQGDPVIDMVTVGDEVVVTGNASTEFWYFTGSSDAPFAPTQGRTISRGCTAGTLVCVNESLAIMVGNDFKVYTLGSTPTRISDNGMEERIRRQIRSEQGLT